MQQLQKDLILNGTTPIAVAKQEGTIYRIEPIQEVHTIVIKNIVKDVVKVVDLSAILQGHYKIIDMTQAMSIDAKGTVPNTDYGSTERTAVILIRMYQNDILQQAIIPRFNRGFEDSKVNYFDADCIWEVYSDKDIEQLTIYYSPVLKSSTYIWE